MVSAYIQVDLSEFDDEDVLRYARSLSGFDSDDADTVRELATAIEIGDRFSAHVLLDRLVRESAALRQAADLGRRQRRAA